MNALTPIPTTFIPLTPQLRRRIEETIEQLVAILDAFDGDADIEQCVGDFGEIDAGDDREPDEDDEPMLGWVERMNQHVCRQGEAWRWDEDEN